MKLTVLPLYNIPASKRSSTHTLHFSIAVDGTLLSFHSTEGVLLKDTFQTFKPGPTRTKLKVVGKTACYLSSGGSRGMYVKGEDETEGRRVKKVRMGVKGAEAG